jgi:hypothetical protein
LFGLFDLVHLTPKAFANGLSHLSMGTSDSSNDFVEAAEETID